MIRRFDTGARIPRPYIAAILLLLMPVCLFGQDYPDTITIFSVDLPYTLPANNTAYRITGLTGGATPFQISSSDNGILCSGRTNVMIFGEYLGAISGPRATLNFAVGGADAKYGIQVSNSDSVIIKDLKIRAGSAASGLDDDLDSGNVCIRETGQTHKVHVRNCELITDGLDGKCAYNSVDVHLDTYNWSFVGCDFSTLSNKFTRRDYYMGSLIVMEFSAQVEVPDYSIIIDSNVFSRAIYTPIAITGSSVPNDSGALVKERWNTFHLQGRNDRYTTFTDDNTHSLGDNFASTYIGLRRGSEIAYNTIIADNLALHYGGSGFLIQGAHGWPNEPVVFHDNWMTLRSGRHIALSMLKQSGQGFYVRPLLHRDTLRIDGVLDTITFSNANQNLLVYRNKIQIYVDSSQATSSTGRTAEGIRVLVDTMSNNIVIANNHISINRSDSAAGLGNGSGEAEIITSGITIAQQDGVPFGELQIFENYFGDWGKSAVRYGSNRESSYGANNTYLLRDTLALYANKDTTFWFETLGSYIGHSTNNLHQDCVFLGYADPSEIVFANASAADSLGKSVEQWRTINIVCLDSDGDPVNSAAVYYANIHDEAFFANSDLSGLASRPLKIRYDHQDYISDSYNPGDSLFNPFTFTGIHGTDTVTTTLNVTASAFTDTLVFPTSVPPLVRGQKLLLRRGPLNPLEESQEILPPNP